LGRPRTTRLLAALVCTVVIGCGGTSSSTTSPGSASASPTASATEPVSPAAASSAPVTSASPSPSAPPTIAGPSYDNPVYPADFPDPHAIRVGEAYYAYATNTGGSTNVPVIRSDDLTSWQPVGDAMPGLPAWAALAWGNTWAPGVIQIGDAFVMYFVDRDKTSNRQCIGVGTATKPEGSFHDENAEPFICQADLGGSIDPFPFAEADGALYLLWKNDGNCCGYPVSIWSQRLSADGLKLRGTPTELIRQDQAWEIPLIENPAMVVNAGKYYLFYSANRWDSRDYAVGYAVCDSITGPCVKPMNGPVFQSTDEARGPGGESFVTATDGTLWMVYHAWESHFIGYPQGKRSMRIDPLVFTADGTPAINGPTTDPQPLP
jgi:beta-xylosidase